MRRLATVAALLLLTCCLPVAADSLNLSLAAALDDGTALGLVASYPTGADVLGLPLYADLGVKRQETSTDCWLGASTDAAMLLERLPLVRELSPALDRVLPSGTYLGAGYLLRNREAVVYLRTVLKF